MMPSFLRATLAAGAAAVLAVSAFAAEPPIIAKARAYLGTDAALEGLKSVRYVGNAVTTRSTEPGKEIPSQTEVIFQKPDQQRVISKTAETVETVVLDGYDGWQLLEDPKNPARWRQNILGSEVIKGLRAIAWESFGFYRGHEKRGGRIEDQGPATIDGIACQKVAFIYSPTIAFTRYFDVATGRLVFTETAVGSTIKEEGEMTVNGIRFPKSITQVSTNAKGDKQIIKTVFEQIIVNEEYPASTFAYPAPRRG